MVPQTMTTTTSGPRRPWQSASLKALPKALSGFPSRMLTIVVLPLLGAALLVSACVGEVPTVPAGDAELMQGRAIYAANCVGCHGADGGGGTGSKLNEGAVVAAYPDPANEVVVIADGKNAMPAFKGKLSKEEIDAVVRFTREGL